MVDHYWDGTQYRTRPDYDDDAPQRQRWQESILRNEGAPAPDEDEQQSFAYYCHYCSECGIETEATVWAEWIDAGGDACGEYDPICNECLEAGNPDGPGYRKIRDIDE